MISLTSMTPKPLQSQGFLMFLFWQWVKGFLGNTTKIICSYEARNKQLATA